MSFFKKVSSFCFSRPFLSVGIIYAVFVILLHVFTVFKGSGHVMFIDITEGISIHDSINRVYSTYDRSWGEAFAEKQRIYIFSVMLGLFKALGLSVSNFVPFRMLFGYLLSIFGFLGGLWLLLPSSVVKRSRSLFGALFLGLFIYLFNPWMTNRIMHNFLYMTPFTVPLFVGLTYRYFFYSHRVLYLLLLGILIGAFTGTPHTLFFMVIFGVFISVWALFKGLYKELFFYLVVVSISSLLISSFWLPLYFYAKPIPNRVETLNVVEMLGRNASVLNNIKLQGYWWNDILPSYTFNLFGFKAWITNLVYFIPFLILLAVSFIPPFKDKFSWIKWLGIFSLLVGVILGGYNVVSEHLNEFLMFNPAFSSVSWLFREVEKLAYFIGFAYALGFFLLFLKVRGKFRFIVLGLFIPVFIVYQLYWFSYVQKDMSKVDLPEDIYNVRNLLAEDDSNYNVAVFPYVQRATWTDRYDSGNYIVNLSLDKSIVPNNENDIYTKNFLSFLLDIDRVNNLDVAPALNMIGVKYLVVRVDAVSYPGRLLAERLKQQESLSVVYSNDTLVVFKNLKYNGLVVLKDRVLSTNLGLSALEPLSTVGVDYDRLLLDFTDRDDDDVDAKFNRMFLLDSDGPLDLAMNDFSESFVFPADNLHISDPEIGWSKSSLTNKGHAESDLYLRNYGIDLRQFNYGHEVALINGGLLWSDKSIPGDPLVFNFKKNKGYNILYKDNLYNITSSLRNKEPYWNILETQSLDISEGQVIAVTGVLNADKYLQTHLKFRFYNNLGEEIYVHAFYPLDNRSISTVVEVPIGTKSMDFSIWTNGRMFDEPIEIKDLKLELLQPGAYSYDAISTVVNNSCYQTDKKCALYARVLYNRTHPSKIKFLINGEPVSISTGTLYPKYKWVKISDISNADQLLNINTIATGKLMSVGAFAVVDSSLLDQKIKENNQLLDAFQYRTKIEDKFTLYTNDLSLYKVGSVLNYKPINSIEYDFTVNSSKNPFVLVFNKPYKKVWDIVDSNGNSKKPDYNLFSTGWLLDSSGDYVVVDSSQGVFLKGLYFSLASFITTSILVLIMWYKGRK